MSIAVVDMKSTVTHVPTVQEELKQVQEQNTATVAAGIA